MSKLCIHFFGPLCSINFYAQDTTAFHPPVFLGAIDQNWSQTSKRMTFPQDTTAKVNVVLLIRLHYPSGERGSFC